MPKWAFKLRIVFAVLVFAAFMSVYHIVIVQGEQSDSKFVLMRLEDVGPGGQYETPEQLGKLRAVLELLAARHVRYQMGVIPYWINIPQDKPVYEKSIDQTDDSYIASFDTLLRYAQQHGAVIGMHGYTHQVGMQRRPDGQHESAIGNEFHVNGVPETDTLPFADERVRRGLTLFSRAGITPQFWETPHYHVAPAQVNVFRSYFGLIHESVPNNPKQPFAEYVNGPNTGYGAPSLGAVHVPTPYSYIPYNRDEKLILDQLKRNKRLPSFFYHPFLEFKHLTAVLDKNGQQVMRDGLPVYQYPVKDKSILQKLITGLAAQNYTFYSIHDYVPFTPAQTSAFETGNGVSSRLGDVTGDRQKDCVSWDEKTGDVRVHEGRYGTVRNEHQPAPGVWAHIEKKPGDLFALYDDNGDGKDDLWIVHPGGKVDAYHSTGGSFVFHRSWSTGGTGDWGAVYPLRISDKEWLLAGSSKDNAQLLAYDIRGGEPKPVSPMRWKTNAIKNLEVGKAGSGPEHFWLQRPEIHSVFQLTFDSEAMRWKTKKVAFDVPVGDESELRIADFNGDGIEDALVWDPGQLTGAVYVKLADGRFRLLSRFGPWGRPGTRLIVSDFDGNGKADIALMSIVDKTMDVALSFESAGWTENGVSK